MNLHSISPSSSTPPKLLVSVRSLEEAQVCLEHPIAILDFKEPDAGALGAVSKQTLQSFIDWKRLETASGRFHQTQFSFAVGELIEQNEKQLIRCIEEGLLAEFSFVKVGLALAPSDWFVRWQRFFERLPKATSPVMVVYADAELAQSPPWQQCVPLAIEHPRCQTVLIDTFSKDQNLLHWLAPQTLTEIRQELKKHQMQLVCAGSLGLETLRAILPCKPDYIGVRGAVCDGNRRGQLAGSKVESLLEFLKQAP